MESSDSSGFSARFLFLVTAAFWCAQYSYSQFINPELESMGASAVIMGLVSGIYGFTQMLVRIPLGILADKQGRQKPFVVFGCALAAMSGGGMLLFHTPLGFVFFRGIAGLAAASWVSFTVLYSSYFPHQEGPNRISHLNIANMSGRLIGYLLVLLVIPTLGTNFAFIFSSLAGVLALFLSFSLKEEPHAPQGINLKAFLKVSGDKYLLICTLLSILSQAIAFSTYFNFSINIARSLNASSRELTFVNIFILIPTLLMTWLVTKGRLKNLPPPILVGAGFFLSAVYCFLMARAKSLTQVFFLQVLAGFANALTFNILLGQSVRDIKKEVRAVAMGLHQSLYGIGMTLGPIITGFLIQQNGISKAFDLVGIFALVPMVLALNLLNIKPRAVED